ncbi:hypothetical protein ACBR40_02385 [Nonomuraea sp. AD125B]|uniref:hypothetical protein n=1 Tax=Nonomuraea sp. AD125B TaxID=3242897 RepID=UPI0035288ABD
MSSISSSRPSRCRGGYVVVYAVGRMGLLDVARLHVESRPTVERLNKLLTQGNPN